MVKTVDMVCIVCPVGCRMQVSSTDEKEIIVEGNSCIRGKDYGIKEFSNPVRVVTTSVRVDGGNHPLVSVKTLEPVPKEKIPDVLKALKSLRVHAPIHIGDIIFKNAADTGIDIVSTRNIFLDDDEKM